MTASERRLLDYITFTSKSYLIKVPWANVEVGEGAAALLAPPTAVRLHTQRAPWLHVRNVARGKLARSQEAPVNSSGSTAPRAQEHALQLENSCHARPLDAVMENVEELRAYTRRRLGCVSTQVDIEDMSYKLRTWLVQDDDK